MRCATSATGSARSGGCTSRRRTGRRARWACRPGRTSSSARWCACCWRRTTSRRSPTAPTGSVPAGAATPRCGRWPTPGPGRPGSSRVTSPTASESSTTSVMLAILAEKIHDNRFLRLVRNMLTAGYLEDWIWGATLSRRAAGRGGVAGPVQHLPAQAGRVRRDGARSRSTPEADAGPRNPAYRKVEQAIGEARRRGDRAEARSLLPAAAQPAQPGSRRSGLPAAALLPLRRRHPARVRRTEGRSRADQAAPGGVPA